MEEVVDVVRFLEELLYFLVLAFEFYVVTTRNVCYSLQCLLEGNDLELASLLTSCRLNTANCGDHIAVTFCHFVASKFQRVVLASNPFVQSIHEILKRPTIEVYENGDFWVYSE